MAECNTREVLQGFVYLLSNPAFPGFYKIGYSTRNPYQRILELSEHSGVPAPFELAAALFVKDAAALERHLHNEFSERRVHASREFFAFDHVAHAVTEFHRVIVEHPEEQIDWLGLKWDEDDARWTSFMLWKYQSAVHQARASMAAAAAAEEAVAQVKANALRDVKSIEGALKGAESRYSFLKARTRDVRQYCRENSNVSAGDVLRYIETILV